MKTDKVNATPAVVIVKGGERKKHVGGEEILKALGSSPLPDSPPGKCFVTETSA